MLRSTVQLWQWCHICIIYDECLLIQCMWLMQPLSGTIQYMMDQSQIDPVYRLMGQMLGSLVSDSRWPIGPVIGLQFNREQVALWALHPGPGCIRWIPLSLLHSSNPTRGGRCTTELEDPSWRSLALPSSASLSKPSRSSQMKEGSLVISSRAGRVVVGPRQQGAGAGIGRGIQFSTRGATYLSSLTEA